VRERKPNILEKAMSLICFEEYSHGLYRKDVEGQADGEIGGIATSFERKLFIKERGGRQAMVCRLIERKEVSFEVRKGSRLHR
jgi:hypothetical protein